MLNEANKKINVDTRIHDWAWDKVEFSGKASKKIEGLCSTTGTCYSEENNMIKNNRA